VGQEEPWVARVSKGTRKRKIRGMVENFSLEAVGIEKVRPSIEDLLASMQLRRTNAPKHPPFLIKAALLERWW